MRVRHECIHGYEHYCILCAYMRQAGEAYAFVFDAHVEIDEMTGDDDEYEGPAITT